MSTVSTDPPTLIMRSTGRGHAACTEHLERALTDMTNRTVKVRDVHSSSDHFCGCDAPAAWFLLEVEPVPAMQPGRTDHQRHAGERCGARSHPANEPCRGTLEVASRPGPDHTTVVALVCVKCDQAHGRPTSGDYANWRAG